MGHWRPPYPTLSLGIIRKPHFGQALEGASGSRRCFGFFSGLIGLNFRQVSHQYAKGV